MTEFNVYVEDHQGNYLDDYIIEAKTLKDAYDKAYERHNWQALEIYIDEAERIDE